MNGVLVLISTAGGEAKVKEWLGCAPATAALALQDLRAAQEVRAAFGAARTLGAALGVAQVARTAARKMMPAVSAPAERAVQQRGLTLAAAFGADEDGCVLAEFSDDEGDGTTRKAIPDKDNIKSRKFKLCWDSFTTLEVSKACSYEAIAGVGSYGCVLRFNVRTEPPPEPPLSRAIKQVRIKALLQRASEKYAARLATVRNSAVTALREIASLRLLRGKPFVLHLHGAAMVPPYKPSDGSAGALSDSCSHDVYMMSDAADTDLRMRLWSMLGDGEAPTVLQVKVWLAQLLIAKVGMESCGIINRDMKLRNILMYKSKTNAEYEYDIAVTDFGLARILLGAREEPSDREDADGTRAREQAPLTGGNYIVTRAYRAPELLYDPNGHYSHEIDMWSIGCIFAELLRARDSCLSLEERRMGMVIFQNTNVTGDSYDHRRLQLQTINSVLGWDPDSLAARVEREGLSDRAVKLLQELPTVSAPTPISDIVGNADIPEGDINPAVTLLRGMLSFWPSERKVLTAESALKSAFFNEVMEGDRFGLKKDLDKACARPSVLLSDDVKVQSRYIADIGKVVELLQREVELAPMPRVATQQERRAS